MNPLITRFIHSRLRLRPLIFRLLLTLVIVGFVFFMTFLITREQAHFDTVAAARSTLIPIIIVQGIILMFLGTGSVASGITQEKLDAVIDYQRMAPVAPWTKIAGYLFGLPIREYAMFAVTLPFLVFALIWGAVPFSAWAPFYLIFFCSVWLYHMTGFAAAMISRRWRWAARMAQGMVALLYFVLPQLSHLGIVLFEYLTVRPAIAQYIIPLVQPADGETDLLALLGQRRVPFFQLEISGALFSLLLQAGLIVIFYRMIERKWNQDTAPSLGKVSGSITFAAVLITGLGNLWPQLTGATRDTSVPVPLTSLASLPLAFAALGLLAGLWVLKVISPERHQYRRGLLRCCKFAWKRLPSWHDDAPALPFALAYSTVLGGLLLFIYYTMRAAGHYTEHPALWSPWPLPVAASLTLLYFHATREYLGGKNQLLLGLLVWIVPLLLAMVVTAASLELRGLAYFILAVSPWGLIALTAASPLALLAEDMATTDLQRIREAMFFGLILIAVLTALFQWRLWAWQRSERRARHE